jgi:hypothetical protein
MLTFWRAVSAAEVIAFGAPPAIYSFMHSLFQQHTLLFRHAAAAEEAMQFWVSTAPQRVLVAR